MRQYTIDYAHDGQTETAEVNSNADLLEVLVSLKGADGVDFEEVSIHQLAAAPNEAVNGNLQSGAALKDAGASVGPNELPGGQTQESNPGAGLESGSAGGEAA